ncbi:MAG: hypothetical protein J5972_03065 [Eubacterium sp.]|nr:hypothetical protein [Eubacterium sp.]
MRKTKVYLMVSLILLACMVTGYFLLLKRAPEETTSGVLNKAELEQQQKTHEEVKAKLGIPSEPGMKWDTTKKDLINAMAKSGVDFSKLRIFQIKDHTDENYVEKMKKELGLPENTQEIYCVPGNGFCYKKIETDCKMTENKMETIGKKLHLGVWQGSKSYGTTQVLEDKKTGTQTFAFDGMPWKEDMYGSSFDEKSGILCGLESNFSLAWEIEDGNLKNLTGFSYEIKPQKIKNKVATKEQIGDYVWNIVERYVTMSDQKEKMAGGDVTPACIRFIPDEITISMTQEIFEEKSNQFVPVIEFNGTVYYYDFNEKKWECYKGGYAVSLESGELYDWRKC